MEVTNDPRETEKARDMLRDAIESLKEGFALYDDDRRLVMFNKRYLEMNRGIADLLKPGLDWEILMRESARRGIYADAVGREEQWVSERLVNGVEFIQDYELTETDGKTYLVSVHPTQLGGFVVTRVDVTDKKQIESVERDGDVLIRTVLDASAAVVTMARIGDGELIYKSPGAQQLYGNTKTAKSHYCNLEDRADYITRLLSDGEVNDFRVSLVNAEGNVFEGLISGRIVDYKGEEAIVSSTIDLTEQLEADALIRRVLEACPVPVQMTKADTGSLIFRSPETTALFGEVENSKTYYVDKDARETYLKVLQEKGEVAEYKAKFKNARGKEFWGAISARLIDFKGEEVIVSNTRDLTNELALEAELSSQREMLFQNEKMSALGELLAGVAHELNNPLSVVVGHALMMRDEITDPELAARVEKIGNAAERCAKIVKTFLAMARQQPTRIEDVDINSVIATAADVAGYGSKSDGIEIHSKLAEGLPPIAADADQIAQVVINLMINAEQAIRTSGVGDQIFVSSRVSSRSSMVEIVVEDNGPGIADKIKARIFEPFFTTKDVGEGTGIGLAFCHRIILSHGGQIQLDPDCQTGSRFIIRLPIAKPTEDVEEANVDPGRHRDNMKALVVDDEIEVGELTAEILRREGFEVDFVSSGKEAIEALDSGSYDLFLSDLNMPEIDGRKIYETLQSDFPEMLDKTAFVTGDTMGNSSRALLQESGLPHVEKPVSPAEFRELISKLNTKIRD